MTWRMIRGRASSGEWREAAPRIYVIDGSPSSWEQDLMVACLHGGEGTAVSHRAAARIWRLPIGRSDLVEVTCPRKISLTKGVLHRSRLPREHIRHLGCIPVTDPTRTLCDLGAVVEPDVVELCLDAELAKGLTAMPYLRRRLEAGGGKGVRGSGVIRRIVDSRDPARAPSESVLESRVVRLLRQHKLPLPAQQRPIYRDEKFLGRVDFVYPERGLIIEADSVTWHFSREDWEADLERRNRLTLAGWRVLHLTWFQIKTRPEATAAKLRDVLSLELTLPIRSPDDRRSVD